MSHRRVLVVDDDSDIREVILESLSDHGYRVEGAANGREALDMLANANDVPCLILLDLMMPVMDGAAFRDEQLKQANLAAIPVVVITAYRDQRAEVKAMGAAGLLHKPMDLSDLLKVVSTHCDN